MKTYSRAPLPFLGSKNHFVKQYRELLKHATGIDTVVDLFGGSGILSRIAKDVLPNARVVYNDFDNYCARLEMIPTTNAIIGELRPLVDGMKLKWRIPPRIKEECLRVIGEYEREGRVDYITISASLLFGTHYALSYEEFKRECFYNKLGKTQYDASGYLDGLDVVRKDFRELIKYFGQSKNVLFVADPPYSKTIYRHYEGNAWDERDDADLIRALHGRKYIFFTSNKTGIIEHIDMTGRRANKSPLLYARQSITSERMPTYNTAFTDYMITNL